jgi:signal transduction histidine kinase
MSEMEEPTTIVLLVDDNAANYRDALAHSLNHTGTHTSLVATTPENLVAVLAEEQSNGHRVVACIWSFDCFAAPSLSAKVCELEPGLLWVVLASDADTANRALTISFAGHYDRLWCTLPPCVGAITIGAGVGAALRYSELTFRYDELCTINSTLELRAEKRNRELMEAYTALKARSDELQHALDVLKETEAQLVQREKLAVFGQLAASIAHEVNNPSTFVLANLEILRDDWELFARYFDLIERSNQAERDEFRRANELEGKASETAGIIAECIDGINRIVKIVADLRTFGHVDKHETTLVRIDQVVDQALRILSPELRHKAKVDVVRTAVPQIRGSSGRLLQVLINIVHNAAQALRHPTPDKNRITVAVRSIEGFVEVEVADNGSGIDASNLERIFEPFFTTKAAGEGTGLGLSISKSIIEQHGGKIAAYSEIGVGTRFVISLPTVTTPGAAELEVVASPKAETACAVLIQEAVPV